MKGTTEGLPTFIPDVKSVSAALEVSRLPGRTLLFECKARDPIVSFGLRNWCYLGVSTLNTNNVTLSNSSLLSPT